jgi:hypothetical protein
MHREKREYFRPADHHGPDPVIVGTKRVPKGHAFTLHTSGDEHRGLLADGYQSTMVSTAVEPQPEEQGGGRPEQLKEQLATAVTRKAKKGEADA